MGLRGPKCTLSDAQRRANNAKASKNWRANHLERSNELARNHYSKNKLIIRERAKQWAIDNPERHRASYHRTYNKHMLDYKWRMSKLLAMAKNRTSSKSIDFNLDVDYLINLYEKANGCCAITKRPFDLTRSSKGKVNPSAPSIDRIVPSLGYIKGNIRIILYHLNVALSEFGQEEFEKLIMDYQSGVGF